jgi:hypothetical protein
VGVQTAVFSDRPEAQISQESEPGQLDGIAQLIEKLDHQAAETPDPAHEPIPLVVQSLASAPTGWAETTPQSDVAQSDADKSLNATQEDADKAAAIVPAENVSAALPREQKNSSAPKPQLGVMSPIRSRDY